MSDLKEERGSIVTALFRGIILAEQLEDFPRFAGEEKETLSLVLESLHKFLEGKDKDFAAYDEAGAQPEEYVQALKDLGLFGLIIPEEYGGIGLSNAAYARVLQASSGHDASTSLTIGAHSSIGMKGLLLFGNEDQKQKYLPKLASGEMIAAFCLTESGSGSDAASISTIATKNEDGSWTLSGEKIWITNGAFAEFFTVFARTDSSGGKLSAFIVERSFEGLSTGPKENKLGIRASATTTVSFDNVIIPASNLLGEEGKGFRIAMEILNTGRTGLGGGCVGGMKQMIALAVEQSNNRKQFDTPIKDFELIKDKISQMTIRCFASESVVRMVSHMIDSGHKNYSIEAAISKIYATESMWFSANEALQIAGGNGFMKDYPYERFLRDCRINMIFEGTNEILRLYVGLSGLKTVGEYLKEVQSSVSQIFNEPIKGFGVLGEYLGSKLARKTGIGINEIGNMPDELKEYSEIFERLTTQLSESSETLIKRYKKDIVKHQLEVKRVADCSILIFVGLCSLLRAKQIMTDSNSESLESQKSKDAVLSIIKCLTLDTKRQVRQLLRRIEGAKEDKDINAIADYVNEQGNFPWDVI